MKLSEELAWRGFSAETTIKDPKTLDTNPRKFYFGADPSADSLTIGNLAAMMMCATFARHGYTPYLLVGGATGLIGDPKDTEERTLKSKEEVEYNKLRIASQLKNILINASKTADNPKFVLRDLKVVDNIDWFANYGYLDFLRDVGKNFSMTQLIDRKFIKSRMGEGGSGISYAEFSYALIQGYDFYHLYQKYGIDLQLCGADQYGNASTGISLIRKKENAEANVWSTPLVIDPATGRKFGKSEGNAIWLASTPVTTPSGELSTNYTTVFDFYQFWLSQPDASVEYLLKIYTTYDKDTIDSIIKKHNEIPEAHEAQKALARGVTEVVHGKTATEAVVSLSEKLFSKTAFFSDKDIDNASLILPTTPLGATLVDDLVCTGLAPSKSQARTLIKSGAISINGNKITDEHLVISAPAIIKKGKNKFAVVA